MSFKQNKIVKKFDLVWVSRSIAECDRERLDRLRIRLERTPFLVLSLSFVWVNLSPKQHFPQVLLLWTSFCVSTEDILVFQLHVRVYAMVYNRGPSASTGEHCICIVSDLLWLGLVWSFVFCIFTSSVLRYSQKEPYNRPFYSCVFSDLALDCKRGWG